MWQSSVWKASAITCVLLELVTHCSWLLQWSLNRKQPFLSSQGTILIFSEPSINTIVVNSQSQCLIMINKTLMVQQIQVLHWLFGDLIGLGMDFGRLKYLQFLIASVDRGWLWVQFWFVPSMNWALQLPAMCLFTLRASLVHHYHALVASCCSHQRMYVELATLKLAWWLGPRPQLISLPHLLLCLPSCLVHYVPAMAQSLGSREICTR